MVESPDDLRVVCWDLPNTLAMIGEARRDVSRTLVDWGLEPLAEDVVLVASELLANAVTYGEPPIRLSLWATPSSLSIRVTDHGPDRPRLLHLAPDALHGRGLTIVTALAPDHGTTPTPNPPGKTVWARWPT
ncbi:ATP-binding protein, partial [Sphaerisporangium aureirubrum]